MIFQAYLIFKTTSDAFECARILSSPKLKSLNIFYEHCPAPKQYTNDCTLAIFLESSDENLTQQQIQKIQETITKELDYEDINFKLCQT